MRIRIWVCLGPLLLWFVSAALGEVTRKQLDLSNEPQYQGRCAYERARFQEWLRARWGSLHKANEVYRTDFRRFEDIELPQNASPYGLYLDRWRFNQDRFVAFHTMLRERIHRYDPDLPESKGPSVKVSRSSYLPACKSTLRTLAGPASLTSFVLPR